MATMSQFHTNHGNDITLDINRVIAHRVNQNDNGIVFTSGPVQPNEKVSFEFLQVRDNPGIINFGFTSHDPSNLSETSSLYPQQGFWYYQLPVTFYTTKKIFSFYVTPSGVIHYGSDEDCTVLDVEVNTSGNLWAFIDILSPSTTIQLHIEQPQQQRKINQNGKIVYAFSSRPLKIDEIVVFKIWRNCKALVFGVTSCDSRRIEHFPDDPALLLSRPERWILIDEPSWKFEEHDELSYAITSNSEMKIWKNGSLLKIIPIGGVSTVWGFFVMSPIQEVTISTSQWNIFKKVAEVEAPPDKNPANLASSSEDDCNRPSINVSECSICCENEANAVLYKCGHMCLCYGCAMNQWKGRGDGRCPLCRREIQDVIKPYR